MTGFFVIFGLLLSCLGVWVTVISIRYLRSGRKAFDLYVELNTPQSGSFFPPKVPEQKRPWDNE